MKKRSLSRACFVSLCLVLIVLLSACSSGNDTGKSAPQPEATAIELTSVESIANDSDLFVSYSDPKGKVPWTLDAQVHMPGNLTGIDVIRVQVESNPLTGTWRDFVTDTFTASELDSENLTINEDRGISYFDFNYYKNLVNVDGCFSYSYGNYRTRSEDDASPQNPIFTARAENESCGISLAQAIDLSDERINYYKPNFTYELQYGGRVTGQDENSPEVKDYIVYYFQLVHGLPLARTPITNLADMEVNDFGIKVSIQSGCAVSYAMRSVKALEVKETLDDIMSVSQALECYKRFIANGNAETDQAHQYLDLYFSITPDSASITDVYLCYVGNKLGEDEMLLRPCWLFLSGTAQRDVFTGIGFDAVSGEAIWYKPVF